MILRKPSDMLVLGYSPRTKYRVMFVDVTESVHAISDFQNAGVASEYVLGGMLASTALMGFDLSRPGESVGVRMECDGLAMGSFTEYSVGGGLRGYVRRKSLPECDPDPIANHEKLLGSELRIQLFRAHPGNEPDEKSLFRVAPPSFQNILESFGLQALQIPTWANIGVRMDAAGVSRSMGFAIQCMPDGEFENFITQSDHWTSPETLDAILQEPILLNMRQALNIPDLEIRSTTPLRFQCNCSRERSTQMLHGLPLKDLQEIVASGDPQTITCHFCESSYEYSHEELQAILDDVSKE